jgi:hypothetical protein
MRVFDILTEATVDSAQSLKSSFTSEQWINIVRSLKRDELNDIGTAIGRENRIRRYNTEFGPQFYAQTPERWASIARLNRITLPNTLTSWQQVYDFLSAHTAPVELTPATPDPDAGDNTQDSTPETFTEVQGWINGPADGIFVKQDPEPNPSDLENYVNGFLARLLRERSTEYRDEFLRNNRQNLMFGNYISVANRIWAEYAKPAGVTKRFVDRQLYAMMVSMDPIFAATQSQGED